MEGQRELQHCMEGGYEVVTRFICPALYQGEVPCDAVLVTPAVYEKIAYRGTTEGIVAIVRTHPKALSDLQLPANSLLMVLERVEKPGNLGAILRSADAAKADAVIVCDPLTDLYNPNLIRSSIGAIFTVPTVACSSEECIRFLQERDIQILTAQLQDSSLYYGSGHAEGHCHRHGDGGYRTDRPVAPCRHGSYPYPNAGQTRLPECQRLRCHPVV